MDSRERHWDGGEEMLRSAFEGMQAGLWTAMPGIIESYDPLKQTVVVQPSIMGTLRSADQEGTLSLVKMPLLLDVPLQFVRGGGFAITTPIEAGDECLVVFASRCIDGWWQSGNVQPQAELRMHDLSDGFAIPGISSVPRVLENVSTTAIQVRSDDGEAYVEIDKDNQITLKAPDVRILADHSLTTRTNGYGNKITHNGGNAFKIDNYTQDADVTSENHPYNS